MRLIKIIPKSSRAKNRVREHGETMIGVEVNSHFQGIPAHLLLAQEKDDPWLGWITEKEADFEFLN